MEITAIDTIYNPTWSNYVWVRVYTDEDIVGLGETFRHAGPIIRYIHDHCAPYLVGKDPRPVNAHAHALLHEGGNRFLGYPTRSVEIRANSACDLALWDIKAKAANMSLCELLGGPVRESIPIYNTCAGPGYNWQSGLDRSRLVRKGDTALDQEGIPDDLHAQINQPGELAQSLLDEGITAMKVWPFDEYAALNNGAAINAENLSAGLERIAAIRNAVGNRMDIMLEYHGLWKQAAALRIITEVDAYQPFWHEDPVSMTEIESLAELRSRSSTPFAGSESHGTSTWFRDALAQRAIDYLHFDLGWIGGLSEALRVSHLAATHDRLIAPHDCTGPVVWIANLHLALSQPHALILESVRAYYKGVYRQLVTELPSIRHGHAFAPTGTGLGTALSEELLDHPDTVIQRSG